MKTFLKIVAGILVVLIVVIVGLNIYFTDERLKNTVMPYVNEAVGREVQVETMTITFFRTFPRPGISIQQMYIPGEAGEDTVFALDELVMAIEFFPLFSNRLNITEIRIDRPRFTYTIYEDGSTNIDFLTEREPGEPEDTTGGYSVNIPQFEITNAKIGYDDRGAQTDIRLNGLDATLSLAYADLIESTLDLEIEGMNATFEGARYVSGLPLGLTQKSVLDMENEQLELREGTFNIRGLALSLNGLVHNWSETPAVDLAFQTSSDNLEELLSLAPPEYQEKIMEYETRGSLSINGQIKGPVGGEASPDFSATVSIKDGYLKYPDLPRAIENIQVSANARNNLITIDRLQAEAGSNTLSLGGNIQNPMDESARTVDLNTDLQIDLGTVKEFYPIDEDSLEIRGKLTAILRLKGKADQIERAVESGRVELTDGFVHFKSTGEPVRNINLATVIKGNRVTINRAHFESGKNNLTITGNITDYLDENPSVNLALKGEARLAELRNYYELEPAVRQLTGTVTLDLKATGRVKTPAQMQFNGRVTANDIFMSGDSLVQPVQNLNGELDLTPAQARLNSLTFRLGSSDITLDGTMKQYIQLLKAPDERTEMPNLTGRYYSRFLNIDELIDWSDTTSAPIPINLPVMTSSVTATVDTMIATGVKMFNLEASVSTTPDRITLNQATVDMFDGSASGSFVWNVPQPDRTNLRFTGRLDSLQAKAFFREYPVFGKKTEFHNYVSGTFSADVDYYTELDKYLDPIIGTTRINGNFGMTKSRLKEHPMQLRVTSMFNANDLNTLTMDEWKSTFNVDNRVLTFKNFKLTSGNIGVELNGTKQLTNNTIDYHTRVYLPGKYKDDIASVIGKQAADALEQENGTVLIPLRMTGKEGDPRIRPDQEVIKPIIQEFLKNKAGKALKKLFDG